VLAHAQLESSQPASAAVLPSAPTRVVLRFSEAVEGRFGAVKVYDSAGTRVDNGRSGHAGASTSTFATGLDRQLPNGRYAATYRVISADGHPISGAVVFSVGSDAATGGRSLASLLGDAEAGAAETGAVTRIAFAAVRALDSLATGLAIGLLAFLLLCWRRALAEVAGAGPDWTAAADRFTGATWRLLRRTVVLGLLVTALGVVFQGAIAAGTSFWSAADPATVTDTLGTRLGTVGTAKLAVWAALGSALVVVVPRHAFALRPATLGADGQALGSPGAWRMLALLVPAAALAVAPALAGHAATQGDSLVLVPSTIVHVTAMSVWVGGLVALALLVPRASAALRHDADRGRLLAALLVRFSPLALTGVLTLQVTGTLQSIAYLESVGDLLHSAFGRAVLVKLVLVLVLVGLGAVNRRRVVPRLQTLAAAGRGPGPTVLLRRVVRTELAVILAVLAVTGALVGLAPPRASVAVRAAPLPSPSGTVSVRGVLGPAAATASVTPARAGRNVLRIRLTDVHDVGWPFTGAQELRATATLPSRSIGPIAITLRQAAAGTYVTDDLQLIPAGAWRLALTLRVTEVDAFSTAVTVRVAE